MLPAMFASEKWELGSLSPSEISLCLSFQVVLYVISQSWICHLFPHMVNLALLPVLLHTIQVSGEINLTQLV